MPGLTLNKGETPLAELDPTTAGQEQRYRQGWIQYYNQRKQQGNEGKRGSRTALEKEHRHPQSMNCVRWSLGRESAALLSGSKQWFDAFMQFWVNPAECSWQVPLRSAVDKTHGGAVHHEIRQYDRLTMANFTRFDLPSLSISFQAGIITPGGNNHIDNGDLPNVRPHSITNFYDFLSLLDQPNITPDGKPNFVNIMYVSPVHGARGIWLRGFFTEDGVTWTDSADNPNTITRWSATFLVCSSNPPLNRLRQSFQAVGIR